MVIGVPVYCFLLIPGIWAASSWGWTGSAAAGAGGAWSLWQQLGVQAAAVGIAIVYAAILTLVILVVVSKTVSLRAKPEEEMSGVDFTFHGEHGYGLLNAN